MWVCVDTEKGDEIRYTNNNVKKKMMMIVMRKENNSFGHLFKGVLSGLHHEKKMSHAGRGSVGRRCVIYSGPTSLSVSDCTMLPQSFLTTTTTGSAC